MRIIGETPEGYIIQIRKEEFANILGLYSSGDISRETISDAVRNQRDLDVSAIYKQHRDLEIVKSGDKVKDARRALEKMLKDLLPIEDIVMKLPTISKK